MHGLPSVGAAIGVIKASHLDRPTEHHGTRKAAAELQGIGGLVVGVREVASLAVVAPITEEAGKGAFLVLLLWLRRAELDGILDGIVYAGMVGIGFAFVENILYLAAAYDGTDGMGPGGTEAVTATFVVRCLFSPFAHPLFTTFIGIGVGISMLQLWLLPYFDG